MAEGSRTARLRIAVTFPGDLPSRKHCGYDAAVLLLDERINADGTHVRTWATTDGTRLQLRDDDGTTGELSIVAVDRVMRRYGKPLEPELLFVGRDMYPAGSAAEGQRGSMDGESLVCGEYRLRRLRYRAAVDADGRDYLVWEAPNEEPLACVATMATAALRYLVLRLSAERPSGI